MKKQRLLELLSYDSETGAFVWLKDPSSGTKRAGKKAGTLCNGYVRICIDGKFYYAHRLAWLYVHGCFPTGIVDHANGDKGDNRIGNLRLVSNSQNLQNQRKPQGSNPSLGVSKHGHRGWRARIKIDGKRIHIGTFASPEIAQAAYMAAKRNHHIYQPL